MMKRKGKDETLKKRKMKKKSKQLVLKIMEAVKDAVIEVRKSKSREQTYKVVNKDNFIQK